MSRVYDNSFARMCYAETTIQRFHEPREKDKLSDKVVRTVWVVGRHRKQITLGARSRAHLNAIVADRVAAGESDGR